jgi:heme-degrading monooxygenase HmoA
LLSLKKLKANRFRPGNACSHEESSVIARMWHGKTPAAMADEYLAFLQQRALPDYRSTPGNLAAWILRRADGDVAHFTIVTHWQSLQSIEAFAGTDIARAKYYPEDSRFLLESEPTVQHSELFT